MAYRSVNPYDGKVLKTFEEISDEQLEGALQNAEQCFDTWRHKTFSERANVLRTAANILRSRADDFARLVTLEMGKLIKESRAEVALSTDIIDYYAENAKRFLAPEKLHPASGEATVDNSPLGVLFGIQPWNFPYYQLSRFVAPNLMAGNVMLVKHASTVPQCAIAFADLFIEAGAPTGAYTNLMVTKDQIARTIADPRVKGVALTGGDATGSVVARQAGQALKKQPWSSAAPILSLCWKTPTWSRRSSGRYGAGSTTRARAALHRSVLLWSNNWPTASSKSSRRH